MNYSQASDNSCSVATSDDYVVTSVWATLCLFGLASNTCVIFAVGTNQKLRWSASYWLVISLSFCDVSMLTVCAVHILPLIAGLKASVNDEFFSQPTYSGHFTNAFAIFIYDAFWYCGVLHLMFMALNRYVSICEPGRYSRLFSRGKTLTYIWMSYVCGIALAAPGLHYCCYLVFNRRIYAAQFLNADTAYAYGDLSINTFSVVIMVICYSKIVIRVRRSRITLDHYKDSAKCHFRHRKSSRLRVSIGYELSKARYSPHLQRPHSSTGATSRRELRLLLQFAAISLIFLLSLATWNWLPRLSGTKWVGFVVSTLFFINNCINPIVYLLFNDTLRRQLSSKSPRTLCCQRTGGSTKGNTVDNTKLCLCHADRKQCGFCGTKNTMACATTTLCVTTETSRRCRSSNFPQTTLNDYSATQRQSLNIGAHENHKIAQEKLIWLDSCSLEVFTSEYLDQNSNEKGNNSLNDIIDPGMKTSTIVWSNRLSSSEIAIDSDSCASVHL